MARPFLSVAILAWNEEKTIAETARRTSSALLGWGGSHEIVLIDDGSADRTAELMRGLVEELPSTRMIQHPRNLGIGAGVRTSFFETLGEWATFFPADLQADPNELPRLIAALDGCDVLATYRDPSTRAVSLRRKLISATDRTLTRTLFGLDLRDLHWVRFFSRGVLDRINPRSTSPNIDTEMLVAAKKLGARIREVPFHDAPRAFGVGRGASLKNVAHSALELFELRVRGAGLK